jgi:hypothetical protein
LLNHLVNLVLFGSILSIFQDKGNSLSTKNIVLTVVCIIAGFFVFRNFYKFIKPGSPTFDQELIRCDIIGEWLKKKNVDEYAMAGISDTLTTVLGKKGLTLNTSLEAKQNVMPNPGPNGNPMQNPMPDPTLQMGDILKKAKSYKVKALILNEGLTSKDPTAPLLEYLKSGGFVYIRSFDNQINDNEAFCQEMISYLKKGQLCIVLPKFAEGDVRKLSMKQRVLAENIFAEDSNYIEFENWHKDMVKKKAEFMRGPPPQ